MDLPKRKNIRLNDYNYSSNGAYFITICTKNKENLLWKNVGANCVRPLDQLPLSKIGIVIENEIYKLNTVYENIKVDKYQIMPNHIHLIIFIYEDSNGRTQFAPTISRIIKQFKGSITKQIGFSIWQKSFYDRIIRNEKEYQSVWNYIHNNPLKYLEVYPCRNETIKKELDSVINNIIKKGIRPKLLLHSCCAPCSSYVLEYLNQYFDITLYYYNPNISPKSEYDFRISELHRLVSEMGISVKIIDGDYEPEAFEEIAKGLENEPERGARCMKCYHLRLESSAKIAKEQNFDYFTTTLSISPMKNAEALNSIGSALADKYGVPYLFSDFKKREGYKRSIELSKRYNLYRQNYCGCRFSKAQAENQNKLNK